MLLLGLLTLLGILSGLYLVYRGVRGKSSDLPKVPPAVVFGHKVEAKRGRDHLCFVLGLVVLAVSLTMAAVLYQHG